MTTHSRNSLPLTPLPPEQNTLRRSRSLSFLISLLLCLGVMLQSCDDSFDEAVPGDDRLSAQSEEMFKIKTVDLQLVADKMVSPIGLVAAPDESERLFVIDQIGKVWIIDAAGTKLPEPFLDVSPLMVTLGQFYDERGLLGLAFHPDYAMNGRIFVYYTAPPRAGGPTPDASWNNISRISEFRVSSTDPTQADLGSEKIILEVGQLQGNHEGGTIAFGPDGYLYISIGDGGGANDVAPGHVPDWYPLNEGGNGQDIEANLLGNILRIDIDGESPYSIPSDNPFVGKPGLDEIYA